MKRIVFFLFLTLFPFLAAHGQTLPAAPYLPAQEGPQAAKAPITVQYPHEKMSVSRGAKNIFIFGQVNVPNATLDINGQAVPLHTNGAFLAYLPVENGKFDFILTATAGEQK